MNVTLAKGSANSLVSGGYRSGLEVESGASVAIGGEGALEAKCFSEGDAHGTGIGGGDGVPDVSVSIAGGAVSGYIILDLEFIFYKKPTILNLNAPLEVIFS